MLIGEISRKSGLSKEGLRYYEEIGLIFSSPRQAGSRTYRDYHDDTYHRLSLISFGKKLGYSLKELKPFVNRLVTEQTSREERLKFLEIQLNTLDERIAEMREIQDDIRLVMSNPEKEFVDALIAKRGMWLE